MNESENFFRNINYIAFKYGVGIVAIERKAGLGPGYCNWSLKRGSSPTIRIAKRLSDAVGYSIDELMTDPGQFRKLVEVTYDGA